MATETGRRDLPDAAAGMGSETRRKSVGLPDDLYDYVVDVTLRDDEVLEALRRETAALDESVMQIAPEQGQLMALLARAIGARQAIELGVFTGYSSLCVARALPDDGRLVACDIDEAWTATARRYWRRAGVEHRIDLRLAPAMETLRSLIAEGLEGGFDFAFIDADKPSYDRYYESLLLLLRPGGLLLVDNALWGGSVADPADRSEGTRAIRALNAKMGADERIDGVILPVGDGLALARKR